MSEELRGHDCFVKLRPSQIVVMSNVRKHFSEAKLHELADSIRENGIIEPLIVRANSLEVAPDLQNDCFDLIAGERRLRAAKLVRLEKVPARIMFIDKKQATKLQLLENVQREDLNPIEEAHAYRMLLNEHTYTQEALGAELGISQSHIANRLRLLELPDSVQQNISHGIIGPGHAKELLACKKAAPAVIEKVAQKAADEGLTVRQVTAEVARELWNSSRPLTASGWFSDPKFDTTGCQKCKKRTMLKLPYQDGEQLRCLDSDCWYTKQQDSELQSVEGKETELQQKYPSAVIVNELDRSTYVIMHRWDEGLINRCTDKGCEYFQQARQRGGENIFYICQSPEEYQNCHGLYKQAEAKEREKKDAQTREELRQLVAGKIGVGGCDEGALVMFNHRKIIYLAGVILQTCDAFGINGVIDYLHEVTGRNLEELDSDELLRGDWPKLLRILDELTDEKLIQIMLEWPALALGFDTQAVEWFFKGQASKTISGNVDWILSNSVGDINYNTAIPKLTDEELLYCIENEKRSSGLRKLQAEARRRGLQTPAQEAGHEEDEPLFDVNTCRVCGCTDDNACLGGCWWVEPDLCSRCAEVDTQETVPDPVHALMGRRIKTIDAGAGVIINVIGPNDDGYYTINYKEPHSKKKNFSIIHGITLEDGILMRYGAPAATLENEDDVSACELEETAGGVLCGADGRPLLDEYCRECPQPAVNPDGCAVCKKVQLRSYLDEKGQEIFVSASSGGETFGSFRRSPSGGLHRVKTPAMPMVDTREEAQANLDAWAKKRDLQSVESNGQRSA